MLLAQELLLLLLDDEKGSARVGFADEAGLAGALLLDLVEGEHVRESDGALVAAGTGPLSPQVLADARAEIENSDRPRDAKHWIGRLPKALKPLRGRIAADLVAGGVLGEERHKMLGLFSSTRYPELDPGPERELRARLRAVLVDGADPDAHTALLVGLLGPLELVGHLVEREHRKAAKARAKAVADRGAVGSAVADAQRAAQAAIIASTTAATIASTTAASSS